MTRSAFSLRSLLVVAALLLAPASALAADDDFEFAEALSRRGYIDLAQEKFEALIAKGGTRKGDGQFGLALLNAFEARSSAGQLLERLRKPFPDVLKLFDSADNAYSSFLKNNPTHKRALDAKLERARLLQQKAEYINLALEKAWVPADVSESDLKKQVAAAFDTAIELLKPVEEKLRDDHEKTREKFGANSDQFEQAEYELAVTWLNRLVALYGKGAALPKGDAAGTAALRQLVDTEIEEFLWSFEERIQGVWALHYGGLAWWQLDNAREAIASLRDAAEYALPTDNPAVRKVTFDSYARLGEVALFFGNQGGEDWPTNLQPKFEKFIEQWPDHLNDAGGQKAALVYARILDYSGESGRALEVAQKVLRKANEKGTGMDREAGQLVSELMGGAGVMVKIPPGDLTNVANAKWREEDFRGAIRAYQAVIAACRTPEDMNQHGWAAWERIGRCYGFLDRWYESFLAFDAIENAWKADKGNDTLSSLTNNTGWYRAGALDKVYRITKDSADQAAANKALEDFKKDHPDSEWNLGAREADAEKKFRLAKDLLRTDPAAGKAAIREAIKAFGEIESTSKRIAQVEAQIADAYRLLGDNNQAINLAQKWLGKKRPDAGADSTVRRSREQGARIVLKTLLTSLANKAAAEKDPAAQKAAWQKVLDALDEYEERFLSVVTGGEVTVLQWRIEAYLGIDDVDKAEQLTWKCVKEFPKRAQTRYVAARSAAALEKEATSWLDKGDKRKGQAIMIRCARLTEFVLDTGTERNPDVVVSVADRFRKGGDYAKAEALLLEAQGLYEKLMVEATADKVREYYADKVRQIRVTLVELLVDQGKYDDAIPQLEAQLVEDETDRAEVVGRLKRDSSLTNVELEDLLKKMSRNRQLLDSLAQAYLEAKTKERLYACINLTFIVRRAHPEEKKHDRDYIRYTMRLAQAYYEFGVDYKAPDALDNVIALLRNLKTLGLLEQYEATVQGTTKRVNQLFNDAEQARNRMR